MQGDEGARAGGVDGEGGSLQTEGVGDAAGGDAGGVAGEEVALEALVGGAEAGAVLLGLGADEDAGAAAAQRGRVDARVFQGLPAGLEEQALLGVGGEGLARGHSEELGVELVGVVEEAAVARVAGAGVVGVGVVEGVEVPAAVVGEGADGVAALGDEVPQLCGRGDVAGEAAAHADDDDRVVLGAGRREVRGGVSRLGGVVEGEAVGGEFGGQLLGEGLGGGVVVDQDERQVQPGGVADAADQFDRAQRAESEVEERPVGADLVGGALKDVRRLLADEGDENAPAFVCGGPGERVADRGPMVPGVFLAGVFRARLEFAGIIQHF